MIGLVKSPFFELSTPLDDKILSQLTPYFFAGETIVKTFKNLNFFACFTNKRIIFIYCPDSTLKPPHIEIEFLPYKSIQRYSLVTSSPEQALELVVAEVDSIQFFFYEEENSSKFLKTIMQYLT